MATTATAKSTLGSIFGMVGTTAGAVTSAVEAGVVGVEMLDRFVQKHSNQQKEQYALDAGAFSLNMLRERAMEDAQRQGDVEKFCSENGENRARYEQSLAFFTAILEESKAKK
jgi:hypothetical protein